MSWQKTNDRIMAVCVVLLCCATASLALMASASLYFGHLVWPLVVSTVGLLFVAVACLGVGVAQLFFSTMGE